MIGGAAMMVIQSKGGGLGALVGLLAMAVTGVCFIVAGIRERLLRKRGNVRK